MSERLHIIPIKSVHPPNKRLTQNDPALKHFIAAPFNDENDTDQWGWKEKVPDLGKLKLIKSK